MNGTKDDMAKHKHITFFTVLTDFMHCLGIAAKNYILKHFPSWLFKKCTVSLHLSEECLCIVLVRFRITCSVTDILIFFRREEKDRR